MAQFVIGAIFMLAMMGVVFGVLFWNGLFVCLIAKIQKHFKQLEACYQTPLYNPVAPFVHTQISSAPTGAVVINNVMA